MDSVHVPDGLRESVTTLGKDSPGHKRYTKKATSLLVAVILLIIMFTSAAAAVVIPLMRNGFFVNENDQTYGSIKPPMPGDDMRVTEENTPDLIACAGIDGTEGYCYRTDLDGEQPNTPEEASEYMKRLEDRIAEMKITGEKYLRIIPLYAEDGITVIGEFGISPPSD
jgi:flagellar basal body-associated protein FliL